ncbi:hypothetical protein VTN96DRAFT_4748 [Rasamsonia emersonii]
MTEQQREFWRGCCSYPDAQTLEKLVDAFRQLFRIGDPGSIRVTVNSASWTPCVVAFTRWCLGKPPAIFLDNGTPVLDQPDSRVVVVASPDSNQGLRLEIAIEHSIGRPTELIVADELSIQRVESWKTVGMMDVESYGQWLLLEFDLDMGPAHQALTQALPYVIRLVVENLRFRARSDTPFPPILDKDIEKFLLSPFRKDKVISIVLSRMLGLSEPTVLCSLESGRSFTDLAAVSSYLSMLEDRCSCHLCSRSSPGLEDSSSHQITEEEYEIWTDSMCEKSDFYHGLTQIVADVLGISLFEHWESLKVNPGHKDFQKNAILSMIRRVECVLPRLVAHWMGALSCWAPIRRRQARGPFLDDVWP